MGDAAAELRQALDSAVATLDGPISADLSGGLDSTSLCFLAAAHHDRLRTLRIAPLDPASDDPRYAELAAAELGVEHLVLSPDDVFAEAGELPCWAGDEPSGGILTHAVIQHLASRTEATHLAGYGGDEVFGVSRAYVRGLLKRQPRKAISHLRAHRALRSWTWAATLRALRDDRSYEQWVASTAAELRATPLPDRMPQFSWGGAVRLPPWTTPAAAELVRESLATTGEPFADDPAQHRAIASIRSAAQAARQVGGLMEANGVRLVVPYLDDTVVEVGLAVDLSERGSPWHYKPLLREAMRPIMLEALVDRRTKGGFAADAMAGLHRLRPLLVELCDEPVLARLGLIDADELRSACLTVDPSGRTLLGLESTLAMEIWLRALTKTKAVAR